MQRKAITLAFLALVLCGAAHAAPAAADADPGAFAATGQAERVIDVEPGARHLNVRNGETVILRQGERSVTWHVQVPNNLNVVPLSRIAPQFESGQDVQVWITPSQQYQNS